MNFNELLSLTENEASKMTVDANGIKEWYLNGKRHREDGPAGEYADGTKEWYINGEQMSKSQFNKWKDRQKALKSGEHGLDLTF